MKTTRLLVTLITLLGVWQGMFAENQAYAVLDSDGLLKFYYDENKPSGAYDVIWVNNPRWYQVRENILSVAFDASFSSYRLESAAQMFSNCNNLASINFANFNTENVTNMSYMFVGCSSLTSLDVSSLNTSSVTNMTQMFSNCSALTELLFSKDGAENVFNTENVTGMSSMFNGCAKLEELDLSSFNTENVTSMSSMFNGCSSLEELDLSSFNTENVTGMSSMFNECTSLKVLDLSSFNTSSVTDMSSMFYGCASLEELDIRNFNTTSVNYMSNMFEGCAELKSLDLSSFSTIALIQLNSMFQECSNLETLDIRNFSISGNDIAYNMFRDCSSLVEILCLNTWYPSGNYNSNNYNSQNMFSDCTNLKGGKGSVYNTSYLNFQYAHPDGGSSNPGYFTDAKPYAILSDGTLTFYYDLKMNTRSGVSFVFPADDSAPGWTSPEYVSSITTVTFDESVIKFTELTTPKLLLSGLSSLTTINNLDNLPTANFTDLSEMFKGCSGLTSLDLSELNTENVTDMSHMFSGCSSLTSIDVSKISTAYVTDMSYMFNGCGSLEELDLSSFNTENVTDMSYMFSGCSSLTSLDVSSFDVDNVTNMTEMFSGCSSLATIYCNNDWSDGNVSSSDNMFTGCPFVQDNNVTVDFAKPSADGGYFSVPPKAYAYLNNHQLIFRYDDNWFDLDNVFTVNEEDEEGSPEWWMFYREVTQVIFEQSFRVSRPTSTANWFASMRYLESITGLENLNTEAVSDMHSMFYGCEKLTSLDLTSFDVSNVTNMSYMFAYCSRLDMIYAGDWSNINCEWEGMFEECSDLPGYDDFIEFKDNDNIEPEDNDIAWAKPKDNEGVGFFSSRRVYAIVEDDNLTFHYDGYYFQNTYTIDQTAGGTWNTATFTTVTFDPSFADYKLTSTAGMFREMVGLTIIYGLDNLNTSSITDMSNMFNGCSGLTTIYCGKDWRGLSVTSTNMFAGCTKLPNFDQSQVTVAKAHPYDNGYFTQLPQAYAVQEGSVLTFYYDNKINTHSDAITYEIPWEEGGIEGGDEGSGGGYPGWINFGDEEEGGYAPARKSAKAKTAYEPITRVVFDSSFKNYHELNSTANMFFRMESLTSIEGFEYLNTENVSTMQSMFEGCSRLTSLDLTSFNTEKVSTMESLFRGCSSLTSLDLTSFNTEKVYTFHAMFEGCSSLTSLNLSNFNTGQAYQLWSMFYGCSSLTTLDLTNFDMTNVTDVDEVFYNCTSLETIFCNDDWSSKSYEYSSNIFYNCVSLKGSNGTTYNDSKNSISFARPDGGPDAPGFFTPLSEGKIILYDSSTNTNTISNNNNETVDVYFCERTLYRDGDWNTLCLPFSVGDGDSNDGLTFSGTPIEGATVMTLDNSADSETGFDPSSGTLTLNFVTASAIEAGKPYLIKWDQQSTDIVNPTFTDVTIQNVSESQMKVATDYVDFVGNFNPITIGAAGDNTKLYLGADNGLYYPNGASTFYGFRAYFQLKNGLTAGPGPSSGSSQVKAFRLNFGDEENGIEEITTDSNPSNLSNLSNLYITLDGRRLLDKPATPGIYIHNGRKVMIK